MQSLPALSVGPRGTGVPDTRVLRRLTTCLPGLQPFMYGDYIAYDCWLGKVYDLKNQIILKLSNGARCSLPTTQVPSRGGGSWARGQGCVLGPSRAVPGAVGLASQGPTPGWSPCQPGRILRLSSRSVLDPGWGRPSSSRRTPRRG